MVFTQYNAGQMPAEKALLIWEAVHGNALSAAKCTNLNSAPAGSVVRIIKLSS